MNSNGTSWSSVFSDTTCSPLVPQILERLGLHKNTHMPLADDLNRLVEHHFGSQWPGPRFLSQSTFSHSDTRYYEQIIAQDGVVPTRDECWHDLFNACIWMQFPQTKWYLNKLHIEDINTSGLHPRTKRRNHLTHFDECGVVLAVPENRLAEGNETLSLLANHQWQSAFFDKKSIWGSDIYPCQFGHANYEMLLNPFVGLTGKWLGVVVDANFTQLDFLTQNKILDEAIVSRIKQLNDFSIKCALPPLPILGVPDWHQGQNAAFYANQDYFRPKRSSLERNDVLLKTPVV